MHELQTDHPPVVEQAFSHKSQIIPLVYCTSVVKLLLRIYKHQTLVFIIYEGCIFTKPKYTTGIFWRGIFLAVTPVVFVQGDLFSPLDQYGPFSQLVSLVKNKQTNKRTNGLVRRTTEQI